MTQQIGPYTLGEPIGSGVLGTVYKALDPVTNEQVALKWIKAAYSQLPSFDESFWRMAKRVKDLVHAQLVTIKAADKDDKDYYYLVSELQGDSLVTLLAANPQGCDPDKVMELARQAVTALSYLHQANCVHGAIKPANLLFEQGNGKTLKLSDSGQNDLIQSIESDASMTLPGLGDLNYLTPEQCRGEKADARSDIYSLGLVLYALVTGNPPFAHESPAFIINGHIRFPLPPLPASCPNGLKQIILRCLEKDPAKRFASAVDLEGALRERPNVGPLPPPSRARYQVQLFDATGQCIEELELTTKGLEIGNEPSRGPGFRIEGEGIIKTHAMINWDKKQVTVMAYAETRLNDTRLPLKTSRQVWTSSSTLRIGAYEFRLLDPTVRSSNDALTDS